MTKANPLSAPARFESPRNYETREFLGDSIQAIRQTRINTLVPTLPDNLSRTITVTCFNTGTFCDQYEPLMIRGCYPANGTNAFWATNEIALEASKASGANDVNQIVLPLQPIGANEAGIAAIGGIVACPVYFQSSNETWIRRADMLAGQTRLVPFPNGSVEILYADSTGLGGTLPAEVDCIVRLGIPQNVSYPGKLNNAASAPATPGSSTNTVRIWQSGVTTNYDVTNVHLDWMNNNENISHDKEVLIQWFPSESRWRFIGAECE